MKWIRKLAIICAITCGIALLLFALWVYWVFFAPSEWRDAFNLREAEEIISKVEEFRNSHGEYPANLTVIGIEEDEAGPYYTLDKDGESYTVWFGGGDGFFTTQNYDSESKTWTELD